MPPRPSKPTLFKSKIAYFAARLKLVTLFSDSDLFCFTYRIKEFFSPKSWKEIIFREKNIGIANVDRSLQVFTLFEKFPVQ